MPAIVTHDTFGKNALEYLRTEVGSSHDCVNAFLLGNQGPDPLFYLVADPKYGEWSKLGSRMHAEKTNEVLTAMISAVDIIPEHEQDVARAYALGFMCHYLLDSTVHPLVYAQEYAMCDAGVPGLTRAQGSSVHATIECEFDEVVMTRHLQTTLMEFSPADNILRASKRVLNTVSTMYLYVSLVVFNNVPPSQLYTRGVKLFRAGQQLFYSKSGIKRRFLVKTEEALRGVSFYGSMSMRACPREESLFENAENEVWLDPSFGTERTESFEDLFACALGRVKESAELLLDSTFDAKAAVGITRGLNFDGAPIGGVSITVE